MATSAEIIAKIVKLFTATDKAHDIVNGPASGAGSTVTVTSGVIPTFSKLEADLQAQVDAMTGGGYALLAGGNEFFGTHVFYRDEQSPGFIGVVIESNNGFGEITIGNGAIVMEGDLGLITAVSFVGDGSQLSNLNSASLTGIFPFSSLGVARKREYKIANFQAVAFGRYHTSGSPTITNPTTGALGDIFNVVVAAGTATINGVTYSASRFPVEVICTVAGIPGTWATPPAKITDTLTVGAGTWTGSTFSGPQTFSGQVQHTGQTLVDGNSSVTRGLGDARYARLVDATQATDETSAANTTAYASSTQATLLLGVGTYIIETWQQVEGLAASGSAASRLVWSGTGIASGLRYMAAGSTGTYAVNSNPVMSQDGSRNYLSAVSFGYSSNIGGIIALRFKLVVTAAGTIAIQYAPANAVAGQTAMIRAGSFIRALQIA